MSLISFFRHNRAAASKKRNNDAKVQARLLSMYEIYSSAHELSEQGAYRRSNAVLEPLLADLDNVTGPLADDMRAKFLGRAGYNYYRLGEIDRAREFTRKALEECRRVGDGVGLRIYRDSLRSLDSLPASKDPRMIELELALLRRLDRGQRLNDQSRCVESNALLESILRFDEAEQPEMTALIERYRGKVNGLMGHNHLILGNREEARRLTEAALQDCSRCGDEDGKRVYAHNLKKIAESGRFG